MLSFRFVLLLVTISISILNAQDFKSIFGIDSTSWSYYTDYGGADYTATINFYTNSDTIIETKNYKILKCTYEMMFDDTVRFGYLREDTVLGKVWFLSLNFEKEMLYMDLSLSVSDTFAFTFPSGICSVDKVMKVLIDDNRKIIEFGNNPDKSFIEGIGSTIGFFDLKEEGCGRLSELLCVFKDGIQTYGLQGDCFRERWNKVESSKSTNIRIFPNPTEDIVTINFGDDRNAINTITLIDIHGIELYKNYTDLMEIEIDLSKYTYGIYFLRINNNITQKIIINDY